MKPLNLQSLYEDEQIIVCLKPPRFATSSGKIGCPDMVSLIKNHISQTTGTRGEPYLAVIHRLDQPVGGILVFAKTPLVAKELNRQLTGHGFGKYYRALTDGVPDRPEGTLENYLIKDGRTNTSRICSKDTPGAKYACLHYKIRKEGDTCFDWGQDILPPGDTPSASEANHENKSPFTERTELDIRLETGRHHQIRVQLAAAGYPIVGDTKYNPHISRESMRPGQKKWQDICLCAYRLEFRHPKTHKPMHFEISGVPDI